MKEFENMIEMVTHNEDNPDTLGGVAISMNGAESIPLRKSIKGTDAVSTGKYQKFVKTLNGNYPGICKVNETLAPYTSYQVGGEADALVIPKTITQLESILRMSIKENIPRFVLGKGANILVHDDGVRGLVISLAQCCNQLFHQGKLLYVGTGRTVKELVEYCEEHGLSGLDFMSGIPGTVGGALTMNAGAFVGEIGDRVIRIDALDEKGHRIQIRHADAGFGYRRADGLKGKLLLGCWLMMDDGDSQQLTEARAGYLKRRAEKQPLEYPSCGSVFKRPPGDYAGRLIEAVDGKGTTVGGAMVAPKHANFIVNFNQATARDIYDVIRTVQEKVYKKFNIWLQPEVKLVGFSETEKKRIEAAPDEMETN